MHDHFLTAIESANSHCTLLNTCFSRARSLTTFFTTNVLSQRSCGISCMLQRRVSGQYCRATAENIAKDFPRFRINQRAGAARYFRVMLQSNRLSINGASNDRFIDIIHECNMNSFSGIPLCISLSCPLWHLSMTCIMHRVMSCHRYGIFPKLCTMRFEPLNERT